MNCESKSCLLASDMGECWCPGLRSEIQREEQVWRGRWWLDFVHVKLLKSVRTPQVCASIEVRYVSLKLGEQGCVWLTLSIPLGGR